jgi:hypothetical protein
MLIPGLFNKSLTICLSLSSLRLWNANVAGGLRGAAYATAICLPGYIALQRYAPKFRSLPLPIKAFGIVTIGVPIISVCAEKGGEAYERTLWTGAGVRELEIEERREQQRWDQLSPIEKVKDWSANHRYTIVGGRYVFDSSHDSRGKVSVADLDRMRITAGRHP